MVFEISRIDDEDVLLQRADGVPSLKSLAYIRVWPAIHIDDTFLVKELTANRYALTAIEKLDMERVED